MAVTVKNQTSFSLHPQEKSFVDEMIKLGRFASQSEVMRAGLRLLQDYEYNRKVERLRSAIAEGEADYEAGCVKEYNSGQELAADIIKRGKERLKRNA